MKTFENMAFPGSSAGKEFIYNAGDPSSIENIIQPLFAFCSNEIIKIKI